MILRKGIEPGAGSTPPPPPLRLDPSWPVNESHRGGYEEGEQRKRVKRKKRGWKEEERLGGRCTVEESKGETARGNPSKPGWSRLHR